MANRQSATVKLDVLTERVANLRDDVKEVKNMVGDKIATKEYVDDRVDPLKKLVYWMLGLAGTILVGLLLAILGIVINRK